MTDPSTVTADPRPITRSLLPAPRWRLLLFSAVGLAAGWTVTLWLDAQSATRATGYVSAKTTAVAADRGGRILTLIAEEGQLVDRGVPIAVLQDTQRQDRLTSARRRLERLRGELDRAEARAEVELTWRKRELDAEIHETKLKIAECLRRQLSRDIEELAWRDYKQRRAGPIHELSERANRSSKQNEPATYDVSLLSVSPSLPLSFSPSPLLFSDRERLEAALNETAARNASEVLATQIELCDLRLNQLQALKQELPGKVRRAAGIDRLRQQLSQAEDELQQAESHDGRVTVTAPGWGRLGPFRKAPGEPIEADETIVKLFDEEQRFIVVPLPSEQLPRFRADKEVTLRFPGNEQRTGRIKRIAPQTLGRPPEHGGPAAGANLVPVIVEPTGKLWPTVPLGTTVEVVARAEP